MIGCWLTKWHWLPIQCDIRRLAVSLQPKNTFQSLTKKLFPQLQKVLESNYWLFWRKIRTENLPKYWGGEVLLQLTLDVDVAGVANVNDVNNVNDVKFFSTITMMMIPIFWQEAISRLVLSQSQKSRFGVEKISFLNLSLSLSFKYIQTHLPTYTHTYTGFR